MSLIQEQSKIFWYEKYDFETFKKEGTFHTKNIECTQQIQFDYNGTSPENGEGKDC